MPFQARPSVPLSLDWSISPERLLLAWPACTPLAALRSHPSTSPASTPWSRWSLFAAPTSGLSALSSPTPGSPAAVRLSTFGDPASLAPLTSEHAGDPFRALEHLTAATRLPDPHVPDPCPFSGGWLVSLSYELGHILEPTSLPTPYPPALEPPWPRLVLHRCPAAYLHDHHTRRWFRVGDPRSPLPFDTSRPPSSDRPAPSFAFHSASTTPADRVRYQSAVARAVEYIHAGDVFQVNLARRMTGPFAGSPRAAFAHLAAAAAPWYGAYLEHPAGPGRAALLSCSPELLFQLDPATRLITTRPIKGTIPGDADSRRLLDSAKDQAELAMIVDLMRNDLGRVCDFGSIRVTEPRTLELHASGPSSPGVLHGVATIQGRLAPARSIADLLCALFPGGSITGAPKVRAMQIIRELEPTPRGPYTGSIGFISDSGHACFNIAIRTALIADDHWSYHTGAGIVADSRPDSEWAETLAKADFLLSLTTPSPAATASPLQTVHP